MLIDKKYTGIITKADGTVVHDAIIFRAQDQAVPAMLEHYQKLCKELGCDDYQIQVIDELKERVLKYQHEHFSKVPDTVPEDIIFDATEGADTEIQEWLDKIENMTHEDMAKMWRFSIPGHPVFVSGSELYEAFKERFENLGGMTPAISKKIGWKK